MRGNIPIPEIPSGEDLWLMVVITSVREKRTAQGKRFCDAVARNATGSLALKIWGETLEVWKEIKPGLWGVTGGSKISRTVRSLSWPSIVPSRSSNIANIKTLIQSCLAHTPWTSRH